jgi:hypothetical protein
MSQASGARPLMMSSTTLQPDSSTLQRTYPEIVFDIPVQMRSLEANSQPFAGNLRRVDRGLFQLSSPIHLAQNAKLEIAFEDCKIKSEVISCDDLGHDGFRIIVRRVYGPHSAVRGEPRIPVDLSGVIATPHDRMFARIVDMSQSGLGLELSAAVPVGARVSVQFLSGIAFGEIRHCEQVSAVYRAGMRIEEFIVRHPKTSTHTRLTIMRYRILTRFLACARRAFCSLIGHEYGWSNDSWQRAVLKCTRCEKVLDALP